VTHPKDWPWSSWSHYALGERGLIHIDSVRERAAEGKSAPLKTKGAAPRGNFQTEPGAAAN